MPNPLHRALSLATCAAFLLGAPRSQADAPPAGLLDLSGTEINPFAAPGVPGAKLLVFVFLRVDCPIANVYAPELQRLAARYGPQGVVFRLIFCDADETPKIIREHLSAFGYRSEAFRDPAGRFAKRSQVKITPEAAVYRSDGTLLYHGRIDDRYVDFGQARPEPTRRDLALGLDAALVGKPVPAASGAAVGCTIEIP